MMVIIINIVLLNRGGNFSLFYNFGSVKFDMNMTES